jgi:hypothetical protein
VNIEALSFKLALDFVQYLKKNRITTSNIRISFFDRNTREFVTYENINEMSLYFREQYTNIDESVLGSLCSLEMFNGFSELYDFTTSYTAYDIIGSYKLNTGSQFDRQRNNQRDILVNKQISFINQAIQEYLNFYNEIRKIYTTGIYSPLYAKPGWSEGTLLLNKLKSNILTSESTSTSTGTINNVISPPTINIVNDYEIKKRKLISALELDILIIENRINFISDVLYGNINFNTTSLEDINLYLEQNGFALINGNYNYLLNMPVYTLNNQSIIDLEQAKTNKKAEIAIL